MQQDPGLVRHLGISSASALVISNMVGTGIFATTGFLAGDLGSPGLVLLVWVVGGVFALAGALCYAELGVNLPRSGGEYVYLSRAYGPSLGFVSGWVSFFAGFSAPIAAAALACAGYLRPLAAEQLQGGGTQALACALIAVFTLLNCLGLRLAASVQRALTLCKLLVLVSFIALGVTLGSGSWQHLTASTARTTDTPLGVQFFVSLLWVMVGYSGWNAATYVAEELHEPQRTLPWALLIGVVSVTVLYLGLNLVFLYAAPLAEIKGVLAVGALAAGKLFGARAGAAYALLMALAILATVHAMVTIGPRVYFAMARDGAFFPGAARVHPRTRVPVVAILWQGAAAMVMCATPFPKLVVYIGFSLAVFTVLAVAALFRLRREPGWQRLQGGALAPVAYLLLGTAMIGYGLTWQPVPSLAALLTMGVGGAVHALRRRSSASRGSSQPIEVVPK